jgi:hypothetical protein
MPAILAPDDQPHLGRGGVAQGYRRPCLNLAGTKKELFLEDCFWAVAGGHRSHCARF